MVHLRYTCTYGFLFVLLVLVSFCAFSSTALAAYTWVEKTSSGSRSWSDVSMSSDGTKIVGVVTSSGYIYLSADGGDTWTEKTSAGARSWTDVSMSSDGTKIAAMASGILYVSVDSGVTWNAKSVAALSAGIGAVEYSGDGNYLVVGGGVTAFGPPTPAVLISTDDGSSWSQTSLSGAELVEAISISADGANIVAGIYDDNNLFYSTDYGATFTQVSVSSGGVWSDIASSADGTKVIALGRPIYATSTNSGVSWTTYTDVFTNTINDVDMSSDGSVVAVGHSQYFYVSTDAGVSWETQNDLGTAAFYAAAVSSDGTKIVTAKNSGYVYVGTLVSDATPPVRSAGSPSSAQPHGTTQVSLSLTTDENATCKYDTTADVAYASMASTMSTTGGTSHSQTVSGLSDNTTYTYYVRCQDENNNANTDDYVITFSVAQNPGALGGGGGGGVVQTYKKVYMNTSDEQSDEEDETDAASEQSEDVNEESESVQSLVENLKDLFAEDELDVQRISEMVQRLKVLFSLQHTETVAGTELFLKNLQFADTDIDVRRLQQFLNTHGFIVAPQGPGSPGQETTVFGYATRAALIAFQERSQITPAVGFFGPITREAVNQMLK